MPDIVRLRYVGARPVAVPALGRDVEPDHIVEFPGRVLAEHPADGPHEARPVLEDADYILIESGLPPQVRAWPKSLWRNETPVVASRKPKGE